MNALLRADARRVLTNRSTLVMAGVVVAYPALAAAGAMLAPQEPALDESTLLQILRGGADVLTIAALLLGILAVAGEYRHGTIVPTLLAAPRRQRWVAAKLGSQAALGVLLAVAVSVVGLVAGASFFAAEGAPVEVLSSDVALTVAAMTQVGALYATIGAAVGAIVKNQTAAVAGALIWVLAVENVVPIVLRQPGLKRWLPGGATDRLLHLADPGPGMASPWAALAILAGLAAVATVVAVTVTKASDIQ